eukprot:m.67460 g.67460  ORF g.67460 m.67460 type:complete len:1335 (+) comp11890_c0_seq2:239-4243(+)
MEAAKTRRKDEKHPLLTANWVSLFFWAWLFPLLRAGKKKQLQEEDVWDLPPNSRASFLSSMYAEQVKRGKKPDLKAVLFGMFWRRWSLGFMLYIGWCVCAGSQPWLVAAIVRHLQDKDANPEEGYQLVGLFLIATVLYSVCINHCFHHLQRNAQRMRSVLMSLIMRKALKLSLDTKCGIGELTNLVSNDCEKIYEAHPFLHYLIASPLFVAVVIGMAYYKLGVSAIIGFGLLLLLIPFQAYLGRKVGSIKRSMLPKTSARTELFSQILQGIQVVKLYDWEVPFSESLHKLRDDELEDTWRLQMIRAITRAILFVSPSLVPAVTIVCYVGFGNDLTLDDAFLAISFFSIVRFPTLIIPLAYSMYHETVASLSRIEAFLEEIEAPRVLKLKNEPNSSRSERMNDKNSLVMNGVIPNLTAINKVTESGSVIVQWPEMAWDHKRQHKVLKDIVLDIPPGSLVGIIGSVGAGKTALLLGLLRELFPCSKKNIDRQFEEHDDLPVAYFSQHPQIISGTFEENVSFGLPFDEDEFNYAVKVSCLEADFAIMPAGSKTEIGNSGVNLSGGQKARVAFARVLYHRRRCNMFLLDDPFSAVDVHVGHTMFYDGVCDALRGTTRFVSASSQTNLLLRAADVILRVEDGVIHVEQNNGSQDDSLLKEKEGINKKYSITNGLGPDNKSQDAKDVEAGKNLTRKEHQAEGVVKSKVYKTYFDYSTKSKTIGGGQLAWFMFFAYIVSQATRVMCDVWLSWWADAESNDDSEGGVPSVLEDKRKSYWIYSLFLWNIGNAVIAFIRSIWGAHMGVIASRIIHEKVLHSLLRAPLLYFQQNPPGRILNRMSTDLHKVDTLLPDVMYQFLDNFFVLLSAVILALAAVPWLFVLLAMILPFYYIVQNLYRATARELNRLDGITKSPIFGAAGEIMSMRVTIRALCMEEAFISQFDDMIDNNLKIALIIRLLERWISTCFNSAASIFGSMLVLVAVASRDHIDPALVGLALVYCLQLMGLASWTMMVFVQVESHFTSLERLLELADIKPQESEEITQNYVSVPLDWPAQGGLRIENAKLRYRKNLPLALRGLDLEVKAQEKIGICGRTGAGKSSILALLFRLFEAEKGSKVCIDGLDVGHMPLSTLRRALAVIPQDPVLFNGTIRFNLDPFLQCTDAELWAALDNATLRDVVSNMPFGLDENVGFAGNKLSSGQRQLVCIARAFLRKARILVCDEATSSVDVETDGIIQHVIRKNFKNHTVLTIAHRLDTILDYDRILVLSEGRVVEFGPPDSLAKDNESIFSSMLAQAKERQKTLSSEEIETNVKVRNFSMPQVPIYLDENGNTYRKQKRTSFV